MLELLPQLLQRAAQDHTHVAFGQAHDLADLKVRELSVELQRHDVLLALREAAEMLHDLRHFLSLQDVVLGGAFAGQRVHQIVVHPTTETALPAAMGEDDVAGNSKKPGAEGFLVTEGVGFDEGPLENLRY